MAPSAVDTPSSSSLDSIAKPPSGVVLPPRDIRAIVEKTAGYVARNGPVFEDRIRQKEIQNPKFSFLSSNDAYHPFYSWRLNEVREGRGTAVSAGRAEEATAAEPEKPKGPPEPPEFQFSARMPNINAQDLDVVRLTALFVAKNGRSFMTALSQRETGNYQFDFLRPQHSLYQFFSRLVDQYTELINGGAVDGGRAEKERVALLKANAKDKFNMLQRARQRAEWVKWQDAQKAAKEEEAEAEKLAYAQIDWHDFAVVETVMFEEADEQTDLPPPTSLNDLQSASLEQKAAMSLQPSNMRIEEAMPTDGDGQYYSQYTPQPPQPQAMPPPSSRSSYTPHAPAGPTQPPRQNEDELQRIRERAETQERAQQAQAAARGGTPMKIRSDYVPRAQAKRQIANMALCPNCKQQIPYDELETHMRSKITPYSFIVSGISALTSLTVELLDPNWRESRAKAEARYATTNLSTADVANNLKRLASQRSDVFDQVTGETISEEEAARRKRAAIQAYDGMVDANPKEVERLRQEQMKGLDVQEQVRRIHERFKQQ